MAINNFKFWCQKVIPLVYDESLSYYETLCKLAQKTNEVINLVNSEEDKLNELLTNGVTKEVRDYIDILLENGTLANILNDNLQQIYGEIENIKVNKVDSATYKSEIFNIYEEIKNTNSKIEVVKGDLLESVNQLNRRIDTIVANSGSGKDSELVDLRTSSAGVEYASAEARVNAIEQMVTLHGSSDFIPIQNNLNVLNNLFNGEYEKGYINDSGELENGYAHTTKFINVTPNSFIYVYGCMGNAIACYDNEGGFLSILRYPTQPTPLGFNIQIPSNTYKIKCNINTSRISPVNFVLMRAQYTDNKVILQDKNLYSKLNQIEINGKIINKNTIYPYSILGVEVNGNICTENVEIFNGNVTSFNLINQDDIRYKCTDYIKINNANKEYTIMSPNFERYAILYNENKEFIQSLSLEDVPLGLERVTSTFDIPNAYYVRFNFKFVDRPIYPIVLNKRVTSYEELDYTNTSNEINETKVYKQVKNISGKRWLFIGDSITEHNYRATKNYDQFLEEWLGIESVNVAKSGTGVTYPFGGNPSWLDALPNYPNNVDVISVMGALNDRHTPLGKWGDRTTETVYGGVYMFFNNLINKYPLKQIVYITSTPRSYCWGADGEYREWIDAFIKTAKNFSIPVLDLYSHSGLRPWNDENNKEYFSSSASPNGDGVHPNAKGQQIMAQKIYDFIKQYIITDL